MNFIKLKSIPKYPTEYFPRIIFGPNYYMKDIYLDNLNQNKKTYDERVQNINSIDAFNEDKNLSHENTVVVKLRNEKYIPDISGFTSPLLQDKRAWTKNSVESLNRFWNVCYRHTIWDHPILKSNKYDVIPADFKCKYNFDSCYNREIYNILCFHQKSEKNHDFLQIISTINVFNKFNITDFSATSSILTNYRNTVVEECNKDVVQAKEDIKRCLFYGDIQDRLLKKEDFHSIFPEYDFKSVFPDEFGKWLNNMHKAVQETDGGKEWLSSLDFNNKGYLISGLTNTTSIGKNIIYHPDVEADGHTGSTMYETIRMLDSSYKLGWSIFVKAAVKIKF